MKNVLSMLTELRPELDFSKSKDFVADGLLDSFDIVALVNEIEFEYDLIIDVFDIVPENFASIDAISSLILKTQHDD